MAKVELKGIGKVYDGGVRAVNNAYNDPQFLEGRQPRNCLKIIFVDLTV